MTYLPPAKQDNAVDERIGDAGKQDGAADAAADEQAGNVNKPGVPNERDNAADDVVSRRGMTTAPMARRVYPVRFQ